MCRSRTIDGSHNDDLILSSKRQIDATNSIAGFHDALISNSPLLAVFSGGVIGEESNATYGTFPVETGSSISIYFQKMLTNCVLRPAISLGR
jgi:hypothetical protein